MFKRYWITSHDIEFTYWTYEEALSAAKELSIKHAQPVTVFESISRIKVTTEIQQPIDGQ